MSLLWSERISPIFLAINLLLLWSKKSHFSQTTSLKKSKKFPDFRIFFPCPQRGKMLIEITVDQGALRRCAIIP